MTTNKFLTIINGVRQLAQAINSSSGSGDANKIIATNSSGKIDLTLLSNGTSGVTSLSGSSLSISLATNIMFTWNLTQNSTLTSITNVPANGVEFILKIAQDSTGGRNLTLTGVTLTGSIDLTANSSSLIKFFTFNGGTSWEAVVIKPLTGTSLWTPSNITTRWWLDPSDSSTISIGSGVSQISDKKGLGNLTQSTASAQPAYISAGLNGKNILRFDGNDGLAGSWDISNAQTVTAVFKQNSSQFNYAGLIGGDFICTSNAQKVSLRKVSDASIAIDSTVDSIQFNIVVFQIAANNAFLRVNGTIISTDTSYNSFSGSIAVGLGGVTPFIGDLAELIITENTLATSNIEKLEGYLASPDRWDLRSRLDASHPYKSSSPMA